MIPRIRPYFNNSYIEAVNDFDPLIPREEYISEISKFLRRHYPNAKGIEFLDKGRNSLHIAFDILNIKKGDEVLIPCFSCPTILEPISYKQITPVLIDINPNFSMDVDQIKNQITKKTKAIVVTHFFGIPSNIFEIKEIADKHGICIIEDCAQTFCSVVDGIEMGGIGDIAYTCFGNAKPLSFSKGSVLYINNDDLLDNFENKINDLDLMDLHNEKSRFLSFIFYYLNTEKSIYTKYVAEDAYYDYFKEHKSDAENTLSKLRESSIDSIDLPYSYNLYEINKKFKKQINLFTNKLSITSKESTTHLPLLMNTFSLNLLSNAIKYIDKINEIRKDNGNHYIKNLKDNSQIFAPTNSSNTPFLRYSILCKNPDLTTNLNEALRTNGYEAGNFNWSASFNKILNIKGDYNKSEYLANNIINLPCHPYLNKEDITKICEIIYSITQI